jgi:hypothetical protein
LRWHPNGLLSSMTFMYFIDPWPSFPP